MKAQAGISKARLKAKVGTTQKVIVDAPGIGRSTADAPEIDGVVRFEGGRQGEFADVKILRSDAHDLRGALLR